MHTILTIVVAAGSGTRMGSDTPKQFLPLDGEPIVMRTLRRMAEGVTHYLTSRPDFSTPQTQPVNKIGQSAERTVDNSVHKLTLVLPEAYIARWQELCREHRFELPHRVVAGGPTRFHSVRNGLATHPDADIVLVHDGVRPFADNDTIARVIAAAEQHGAAIPAISVVDSLRKLTPDGSEAVERAAYRAVQTPQAFRGTVLRCAYEAPFDDRFTDDASVVELTGTGSVVLTEGNASNIKITTPIDLAVAEIVLKG